MHFIRWIVIYPVDIVIQALSNWGLVEIFGVSKGKNKAQQKRNKSNEYEKKNSYSNRRLFQSQFGVCLLLISNPREHRCLKGFAVCFEKQFNYFVLKCFTWSEVELNLPPQVAQFLRVWPLDVKMAYLDSIVGLFVHCVVFGRIWSDSLEFQLQRFFSIY